MKRCFLFLSLVVLFAGNLQAQLPIDNALAELLFKQLLMAELTDNYDSFVANGTLELKAALSKTQFDASSALMKDRLKGGYDSDSLGELNQKGYQIYLYRLRLKDGSDDILATMTLKDGKVAGIFFK